MKRIVFIMFLVFFIASSSASLGNFEAKRDLPIKISLLDTNGSHLNAATDTNLTIEYPNGTSLVQNVTMEHQPDHFNYTLDGDKVLIGEDYTGRVSFCNGEACGFTTFTFDVTPSGGGGDLTSFYFILIGIVYIILIVGFWTEDITITMLGTFGLFFLGLYVLLYGINIQKNFLTEGFAFINLGLAMYISVRAGLEYIST